MKTRMIAVFAVAMALCLPEIVPAEETVCLEAESASALQAPMAPVDASKVEATGTNVVVKGASGDRYIEVAQGKGNPPRVDAGSAAYEFEVREGGDFVMWCRVWWEDECGNSIGVSLDGATPFILGQDGTFKSWHWVKAPLRLKQLALAKGGHTLKLLNREDGVRVDQWLLTTDARFVPVGIESPTGAAVKVEKKSATESR